jgi:hypothetical protein
MSLFDWLTQSPRGAMPAAAAGAPPAPRGLNNLGLIGAGLSDLSANVRGAPANNVANFGAAQFQQGMMQRQINARAALVRARQAGDTAAANRALSDLVATGGDPGEFAPKFMALGAGVGARLDPITGQSTLFRYDLQGNPVKEPLP